MKEERIVVERAAAVLAAEGDFAGPAGGREGGAERAWRFREPALPMTSLRRL